MTDAAETTRARPWRGDGWGLRMAGLAWIIVAATPFYLAYCLSFARDPSASLEAGTPAAAVDAQKLLSVARGGASGADSNLPTVARIFLDSQWTILTLVLGLTAVSTWRLYPILWRVVHTGLANHVLLLEVALVLWLVYGGLSGMGMPGLFWSPEPSDQFTAGMGVTLFIFWMLYLLFVSDYEAHREDPEHRAWSSLAPVLRRFLPPALDRLVPTAPPASEQMGWFVFFAASPILTMLALPAVLPTIRSGAVQEIVAGPWLMGLAGGAVIAVVVVLTRIPTRLNELRRQALGRRLDLGQLWRLDSDRLDPEGNAKNMLIIVGILYLVAWVFPNATQRMFPPAFSLCILLGVLATFSVWLGVRQHRKSRVIAAVAVLTLVAGSGMLDYDVVVRDLAGKTPGAPDLYPTVLEQYRYHLSLSQSKPRTYGEVVDLAKFQKSRELSDGAADFAARQKLLDRWLAGMRWGGSESAAGAAGRGKPIVVVVTTSGGALRAGVWTQAVLRRLDETFPGFHRHTRLITGASGGMLGAARYVALHAEHGADRVMPQGGRHPDFLAPIAWQIAFHDFLPNALTPFPVYNRGDKLEDVWLDYAPELGRTFGELAEKEKAGEIPSIVFSPMLVEDGRRVIIANLPMADMTVHLNGVLLDESRDALLQRYLKGKPKDKNGRLKTAADVDDYDLEYPALSSFSAMEFSKLFAEHEALDHLRLASAVRMSATFPFITSVVTLPTFPARHVVDAGYYDNYGVNLGAAWINSHKDWLRKNAAGVLVVQVRAFRNEKRLKILDQEVYAPAKPPAETTIGLYEWVAWGVGLVPQFLTLIHEGARSVAIPAQGVAMARESSMFFRNDENLEVLHDVFKRLTGDDEFFRTVVFTCDTIQVGQAAQNVETLNWYIDPVEYRQIEGNMNRFDPATQTGRDRNHLRLERLKQWWRSRGGEVAPD
ncbi:hypothetical protein [Planctomyces sp. SH-PL62]|uniref:hypothetical protein n=1 Tax=Planctomyces sp. SH-PL62 TaxID=1636152 RepID=UPI00078DA39B|nr:hypothetical protein [Planctomyces sp. SH-PL62]AMV37803.1 hypothetical protein VT85_10225 [Planctomyces sp. SH-PL62]